MIVDESGKIANMKKWLRGAGDVLSNVAEVVAPTVKTPLESFKRHWNAIRNFYIDQKNDVDSGNIPTHLHSIVQILLEEDDERSMAEGPGPCMEFFMQNRIMETLCALCLVDKPTGVRRLILAAINSVLGNMKIHLVPHMSVHQPLTNLLHGMTTMQLGGELVDALALIRTCLNIVASDPVTLGDFFLIVSPADAARGAAPTVEYSIWSALVSLFKRTSADQREKLEDLLVRAINSASPRLMDVIMATEFHSRLAEELLGLFSHLPKALPTGRSLETEHLYRYKLHVRLCNALTSPMAGLTNSPNSFSDSLLLSLEEVFLERALIPALHDQTGSLLARDTLVAKETLQLLTGPLQDAFVSLSVGLQAAELRDRLCSRILSSDSALAIVTMRLFDVICGLYHSHATESLMLSHISTAPISSLSASSTADSGANDGDARCVFEPILGSFPAAYTPDRLSGAALDNYTLHARSVFVQVAKLHASLGIPPDNDRVWVKFEGGKGPFLDTVFAKLRRYLTLSLKECLLVTSLISRVLTYPSRPLFECVSHAVVEAVAHVGAECELHAMRLRMSEEGIGAALEKAYGSLAGMRDFEIDVTKDETAIFFQKVVILDEFVREVVAIDSARAVFEIENRRD